MQYKYAYSYWHLYSMMLTIFEGFLRRKESNNVFCFSFAFFDSFFVINLRQAIKRKQMSMFGLRHWDGPCILSILARI